MRWSLLLCAAAFSSSACVINAYQTDFTTKPYLGSVVGHCFQFAQDALAVTRPMRLSLSASKAVGFVYDGWLLWPSADTVESDIGPSLALKRGDRFIVERAIRFRSVENTIEKLYIRLGPEHDNLLLDGADFFGVGALITKPEQRLIGPCLDG